jgi:hypothetical protein
LSPAHPLLLGEPPAPAPRNRHLGQEPSRSAGGRHPSGRVGPEGPRRNDSAAQRRRDGTWPRCRPEDDHMFVHSRGQMSTPGKPSSDAVAAGARLVTVVDTSRSCPQECAQVGEISCVPRHKWSPSLRSAAAGGRSVVPNRNGSVALTCAFATAVSPSRGRVGSRRPAWARPGDFPGVDRGQQVEERRPRCTTVEMSTCRQQKDADHPQSANRAITAVTSANVLRPQDPHV